MSTTREWTSSSKSSLDEVLSPARVGRQLKIWRVERGMTQADVAQQIGVSAQQYQKYEAGITKLDLSRLFSVCSVLDRSPSVFLEKKAPPTPQDVVSLEGQSSQFSELEPVASNSEPDLENSLASKLDLSFAVSDVVQNFMTITDPNDRAAVLFIMRSYADKARRKLMQGQ
ncbi:MAG: helix-turn-helix transcriptional regulator [Pseudomonadota bacterium]